MEDFAQSVSINVYCFRFNPASCDIGLFLSSYFFSMSFTYTAGVVFFAD